MIIVPKHINIQIECRVTARPLKDDITMLFQPDLNPLWPEITMDVSNPTCHDSVLPEGSLVGTVQTITIMLPVGFFKESSNNTGTSEL